jgi:hypothetical protein
MNFDRIIQWLGYGFLLWGIIWSGWSRFPIFGLIFIGICLIITGTGNKKEEEHEMLSKKAFKAIKEAESDCPHCPLARKSGHKQCLECGKKL